MQWEEDRKLMVEYAKKLEREEYERANAFKARYFGWEVTRS